MAGVRTALVWTIGGGDALDAGRADQPRQLHLLRPADRELGLRPVRLRRLGAAWRSSADQLLGLMETGAARRDWRRGAAGRRRRSRWRLSPRCAPASAGGAAAYVIGAQEFLRAVHPGRADGDAAGGAGASARSTRGARFGGRLPRAGGRRDRRLRRLFRHAVDQRPEAAPTTPPRDADARGTRRAGCATATA